MTMILTYQQALEITKKNSSFYVNYTDINWHRVAMFNYLLADYNDFKDNNAFEMRGLTFVRDLYGNWSDGFLHLHKFFNLNQTTDYMLKDVSHKVLTAVYDKLDGSMIRFVQIGDKVYAKTKMSFISDQAIEAQKIYESNKKIKELVDFSLKNDLAPIFEFVSPSNRIVVGYNFSDLVLLAIRNNKTGKYLDVEPFAWAYNLRVSRSNDMTLEEVIKSVEHSKNIEGYVLHFADGQMMKVKTKWYLKNHRLLTVDIKSTHFLIACVLDDTIDDLLSSVPEDQKTAREYIIHVTQKVSRYINDKVKKVSSVVKTFDGDRKTFALNYKSDKDFHLYMKSLRNSSQDEILNVVKDFISKNTNSLQKANQFLGEI
jgi:RNA ligase